MTHIFVTSDAAREADRAEHQRRLAAFHDRLASDDALRQRYDDAIAQPRDEILDPIPPFECQVLVQILRQSYG